MISCQTPFIPMEVETMEKRRMAVRKILVVKEYLCSPINDLRLPRYRMHPTVNGRITALNACETIITKTGRA